MDENILEEVRVYAARRDTTVNALVRGSLTGIAEQVGAMTWSRGDLHGR